MSFFVDKLGPGAEPTGTPPQVNLADGPAPPAARAGQPAPRAAQPAAAPQASRPAPTPQPVQAKAAPAPEPEPDKKKKKGWF